MKKIYHLSTCSTCQRIMKDLGVNSEWIQREIKSNPITKNEIDEMQRMAGSFEKLFSRRAMKFRSMGLQDKELQEEDYKSLILSEYTFLKRPVIIIDEKIFIGNAPKTVESIKSVI